MELEEKLKDFSIRRGEIDQVEAELKEMKSQLAALNAEITEEFINKNIQNMTVKGVGRFSFHTNEIPKIEDEVACKTWLRDKGDMDLVLAFHASKFKAYYKSLVETGEPLPPGVGIFVKTEVRLTAA